MAANRVAAINPAMIVDDTDPIRKFRIDPASHTNLQNPAEITPKGKPIRNFSIDHTSSIRTRLRTPVFADAISETSIEHFKFYFDTCLTLFGSPKDPAVLKILRHSKLTMHSKFTMTQ